MVRLLPFALLAVLLFAGCNDDDNCQPGYVPGCMVECDGGDQGPHAPDGGLFNDSCVVQKRDGYPGT